jgi:hypothetical protein
MKEGLNLNKVDSSNNKNDDQNQNEEINNIEKKKKLTAVPIFRENDLFCEIFSEVEPAFNKNEEPNIKAIIKAILKTKNNKIILDRTCERKLFSEYSGITPEDFPEEIDPKDLLTEKILYKGSTTEQKRICLDKEKFMSMVKKQFNIEIENEIIDRKIEKKIGYSFSPEMVDELLNMAIKKNDNEIKNVYVLIGNLIDHTGKEYLENLPSNLELSEIEVERMKEDIKVSVPSFTESEINNYIKDNKEKFAKVLDILKTEIKKVLDLEPKIIDFIEYSKIEKSDLVIVDRHNLFVRRDNMDEKIPKQVSMLPMETELKNNRDFLGKDFATDGLIEKLREEFTK